MSSPLSLTSGSSRSVHNRYRKMAPADSSPQSYLLSIRPYLQPKPTSGGREKRGPVEDEKESRSLVQSADQDEVFHWGREVDVDWAMVTYLTVRDHVSSQVPPLLCPHADVVWVGAMVDPCSSSPRWSKAPCGAGGCSSLARLLRSFAHRSTLRAMYQGDGSSAVLAEV